MNYRLLISMMLVVPVVHAMNQDFNDPAMASVIRSVRNHLLPRLPHTDHLARQQPYLYALEEEAITKELKKSRSTKVSEDVRQVDYEKQRYTVSTYCPRVLVVHTIVKEDASGR